MSGEGELKIIRMPYGPLKVWTEPMPNREYVVGVDTAEGKVRDQARFERSVAPSRYSPDLSAMMVLDMETTQIAASWHGNEDLYTVAKIAYGLGIWFNTALMAIEVGSGAGQAVQDFLCNTGYPNFYVMMALDKINPVVGEKGRQFGWKTNNTTRPMLIKTLQEYISDSDLTIRDIDLLRELKTMEVDREGKARGIGKNHDDIAFAFAIALKVRELYYQTQTPGGADDPFREFPADERWLHRRVEKILEEERDEELVVSSEPFDDVF